MIRTEYFIRGLELMKLFFAFLDVSLTISLTHCYKTEGFYIYNNNARLRWDAAHITVCSGTDNECRE